MSKLPTRDDILGWIADNPTKTSKRDIARAFGIKGQARIDLKRILKDLEADGSKDGLWKGQIYAERFGEYRDAKITLAEPDRMKIKVKVGFMSRTVEWVRVDAVPAVAAD